AYVDPELTLTVPDKHTAATGLDALVHAVESYWALSSTPFSEPIALEAIKLILDNLTQGYRNPEDRVARTNLSLGSLMAGIAFSQTRTTILHALSYPLTVDYHLEHGFACSVLLKPMLQTNAPLIPEKMARLLDYLGSPSLDALLERIEGLMQSINAPTRLSTVGVQEEELESIADQTMRSPITKLNPKSFTREELVDWLKEYR
ncbi:MAG TPA: iron-containing alcohol dehydrogenase, partial [Thermotogota bacterium]|nr:iron-containing alcohol dehydrogenase [Thermotogota bacterium]